MRQGSPPDPEKEYIVYEFWSKKLIGTFKGTLRDAVR